MGLAELETISPTEPSSSPQDVALRWVADLIYAHLLQSEAPVAGRELLPVINARASVGAKALKHALDTDPRIRREERRWVAQVPGLDPKRPIERSIVTLIETAGCPLSPQALGRQLSSVYPREEEALMDLVHRLTRGRRDFFAAGEGRIGLLEWLLDPSAGNADDVEFENFEETDELDALRPLADRVDWESGTLQDGALRLLDQAGKPVSNKALQFFLWRARPQRFDAAQQFRLLLERPDARLVSPASWVGPGVVAEVGRLLNDLEGSAEIELTNEDVPKPITVEPEDIDVLAEALSTVPTRTGELLGEQFPDLRADDPNYPTTFSSLDKAIRSDARFMWVGWDRWTTPQTPPDSARVFPEILNPVVVDIEISAGQREDVELDDEGLEGALAGDIENPLVKYGASLRRDDEGRIHCILTYGVRQSGILPVGDDASIFPRQPDFLLVTTADELGQNRSHWVNNELRLMYNMGEWYEDATLPQSGGVFTLEPQTGPGHYFILTHGETDPETYLDLNRIKDLQSIKERAVAQETSTREIIQEIMRHHSKGVSFPELYAEVIVARMTSARMIASILSSYYEFYPKGRLWLFNERDAAKGFKKQKKKYLRRR